MRTRLSSWWRPNALIHSYEIQPCLKIPFTAHAIGSPGPQLSADMLALTAEHADRRDLDDHRFWYGPVPEPSSLPTLQTHSAPVLEQAVAKRDAFPNTWHDAVGLTRAHEHNHQT